MAWTEDRVEQLKRYWAEGLSASQIASKMGGVTRNAVIGKVHRLGLSGRATPAQPKRGCATAAAETADPIAASSPEPAVEAGLQEPEFIAPVSMIESDITTAATLQRNMCKWPVGDPASDDFHFCGQSTTPGKSYCAYHARMAFQPAGTRRSDAQPPARTAIGSQQRRAAG